MKCLPRVDPRLPRAVAGFWIAHWIGIAGFRAALPPPLNEMDRLPLGLCISMTPGYFHGPASLYLHLHTTQCTTQLLPLPRAYGPYMGYGGWGTWGGRGQQYQQGAFWLPLCHPFSAGVARSLTSAEPKPKPQTLSTE
jgi:hypothetical protein